MLEQVGQGAYGIVCAAQARKQSKGACSWRQDEDTQESVAMKKIENAFEHITCRDPQRKCHIKIHEDAHVCGMPVTKRTLRELRILRHLRHENLIDVRPGIL